MGSQSPIPPTPASHPLPCRLPPRSPFWFASPLPLPLPPSFFSPDCSATSARHTLSLHDALPISWSAHSPLPWPVRSHCSAPWSDRWSPSRSEEHTTEHKSCPRLGCPLLHGRSAAVDRRSPRC